MSMFTDSLTGAVAILNDPIVWLLIIGGALFGSIVGALPGLGTTLAYSLLIPVTLALDPVRAVAMLLAVSVGGQFGNSLPAILVGIPGGPSAVLTVVDGHTLYKRGQGDIALGATYLASLAGQLISIPLFIALVIPLANLAYVFQNPELFGLYTFGMVAIVSIAGKNMLKGLLSAGFGLMVGLVGLDPLTVRPRFTFGIAELRPGFETAAVVIGLLAIGEILRAVRQTYQWGSREDGSRIKSIKLPRWSKMGGRDMLPALLGGSLIGTLVGAIPGAGATPAALISYQQAKLWSRRPQEFGKGSLTGITANEAAQNASNSGELIPTFALGIPSSGSMLILLSALTLHGFIPGPFLVREDPELLQAAIAGLLGGTIILILIGMKMAGWMLRLVSINRSVVLVGSLAITIVGVYSLAGRMVDVIVALGFGVVGYFMHRYGYSPAAASMAVVLSGGFESSLRQGLALTNSSWIDFVTRPTTAGLLSAAAIVLVVGFWREMSIRRAAARAPEPVDPPVSAPDKADVAS